MKKLMQKLTAKKPNKAYKFSYLPCACGAIHKLSINHNKEKSSFSIQAHALDKSDIPAITEILNADSDVVAQLKDKLEGLRSALSAVEAKRILLETPAKKDFIN